MAHPEKEKTSERALAHHIARKYRITTKISEIVGLSRQNAYQQLAKGRPTLERATAFRDAFKQLIGLEFDVVTLFAHVGKDEAERLILSAAEKKAGEVKEDAPDAVPNP